MARILHLIAANHRRGAETFAVELAEHFRGVGHDVRVMAVEDSGTDEPLPVELAGRRRTDPGGIRRVLEATRWSDVLVGFGSTSLLTGAVAARVVGRPFVYRNIGDPSVWGRARLSDLRIGGPIRTAATVVALYPDAARTLVSSYRLDPALVRVVPRGVPEEPFAPASPAARDEACVALGLDPGRRWLAYVGALSPEKDPLLPIDALRFLDDQVGLVVAGGGPLETEAREMAAPLGRRVRFAGVLDDVRPVYASSDALVLPSRTEGIPGAAIEAGLSGLPTVSFDVGGVASVVVDRETGRLSERRSAESFAAAVEEALRDRERLGRSARDRCLDRFTMRSVGAEWEKVVTEVVAERHPARRRMVLQVAASTERRGAEVFAHQLGAALERSDIGVTTVAITDRGSESPLPFRVLGRGRFRPGTLVRLYLAVRRAEVSVVHGGAGLWPTAIAAALARRPFVYRGIGDPSYWGDVAFGSWRIGVPLRRAVAVAALYDGAAAHLAERYGIAPDRIELIPNAVPSTSFGRATPELRRTARASLGLGLDDVVVGYLGALSAEKRPEWTIQVVGRMEDAHLAIAGDGAARAELGELAERLAPRRVHFVGTVVDPATFLAALDVLLVPSRTEGSPANVIEAALVGVPVVATAVGGVPQLVADLDAGVVTPVDDLGAFHRAAEDAARTRPSTPSPPAEVLNRYDIDTVAGRWRDLILRAAGISVSVGDQP